MTKTHQGGCHCKAVRYEAELDLTQPVLECNCSHCAAKGMLLAFVPRDKARVTQGEENLTEYRFNTQKIAHLFCTTCGVQPLAHGADSEGNPLMCINVRTIDDVDLDALERKPVNGKDF